MQLHQPLHAAGFYLNPEFFYKDIEAVKADKELFKGVVECIEKLVPCEKTQDEILYQLTIYELAEGLLGNSMAIRQKTTSTPGDFKFLRLVILYFNMLLFHNVYHVLISYIITMWHCGS